MFKKLATTNNFEVKEMQDGTKVLVGIDKNDFNNFIKQVEKRCQIGKIYRFAAIEELASRAQHAFLFVVYEKILLHLNESDPDRWQITKESELSLRLFFENGLLQLAKNRSDIYPYERWVLPIYDPASPDEIKDEVLYPCSSWTSGQAAEYLGYLETVCHATFENFFFPDPSQFKGERKNERLFIQYPEKQYVLPK